MQTQKCWRCGERETANGEVEGEGGEPRVLRRIATGVLLCGLASAAALIATGRGSAIREALEETRRPSWETRQLPWKLFPLAGYNSNYPKLALAFEVGQLRAPPGRLPPLGFDTAPAEGWDGLLPVEPLKENEVKYPLTLKAFERLPAAEQANISAVHALEAAEVAKNAYSGDGGEQKGLEQDQEGAEGPAAAPNAAKAVRGKGMLAALLKGDGGDEQDQEGVEGPAAAPAAAKAVRGQGMLAALQKIAAALTAKALAAVNELNQAEMRIEHRKPQVLRQKEKKNAKEQEHTKRVREDSDTHKYLLGSEEEQPEIRQRSREASRKIRYEKEYKVAVHKTQETMESEDAYSSFPESSEREALLAAKREVDNALRRLADRHQSLQYVKSDLHEGEWEGKEDVEKRMSRAQKTIYSRYENEYQTAVHDTEEQVDPRDKERDTFVDATRKQSLQERRVREMHEQATHMRDAQQIQDKRNHVSYIPQTGPLQRASIVKDVPIRNWPMVGQYGHTHSWPFVAMNSDLVMQNQDPVVAPTNCADDPISVDCTGMSPSKQSPSALYAGSPEHPEDMGARRRRGFKPDAAARNQPRSGTQRRCAPRRYGRALSG